MIYLSGTSAVNGYPILSGGNIFATGCTANPYNSLTVQASASPNIGMTLTNAGIYQVTFGIGVGANDQASTAYTFTLSIDGSTAATAKPYSTISFLSEDGHQRNLVSFTTIITVTAGQTLSILNASGGTRYINSPVNAAATAGPAAYISVIRLK
jgi:hypothetical protein